VWAAPLSALADRDAPKGGRSGIRILVVDDSDELMGLISRWLEDEGYEVVTAGSGSEAIDAAAVYHPDIVLLDLILPAPDGFAVYEALQQPLPPEIILMTGLSDPKYLARALALGVVGLLRKPLTRETVVDMVAVAAKHRRGDPLGALHSQPRDRSGS
jgi:CheY-like chemotaxis protein